MATDATIAVLGLLLMLRSRRQRRKRVRSCWVKPWLRIREDQGAFANLQREFQLGDRDSFRALLRMDVNCYTYLCEKITPFLQKRSTNMRKCISAEERLSITLRFLATGETYRSLAFLYRVHSTTIGNIVPETCQAIVEILSQDYYQCPRSTERWLTIAEGFNKTWNFPNCIGAIDGKHVKVRAPQMTGSQFFNYKGTFSIVLLAVVDSAYKFLYVDIGSNGRVSDGGVFGHCSLNNALNNGLLNIPKPSELPGSTNACPYMLVGDEAFPMRTDLMKPYPRRNLNVRQKVFNYRLSRARRVVENAFGMLTNRFRIFHTTIALKPETVELTVHASCALHNFLRSESEESYLSPGTVDGEDTSTNQIEPGEWRSQPQLPQAQISRSRNPTLQAKEQRDKLCEYFNSPCGEVPWQLNMV